MTQNYISGAESVVLYAFEDPDNWDAAPTSHTASDETKVPFGQGVEVNIQRSNSSERIYGVGNRNATASVKKQYAGTATVSGTLTNAYWLLGVMGANVDAGTTGAYTHTYTETNVLPSFTIWNSMELGDTDSTSVLLGARVASCSISAAVNETLKFSLECPYRYETHNTTAVSNIADVEPVFTFAHGSVELPDGTSVGAVQSFTLTIVNTTEAVYGIGSRFVEAMPAKNREYNIQMNVAWNDYTKLFTYFLNGTNSASAPDAGSGTEIASLELTFTNDDGDILDINLTGITLDEQSLPQSANEIVKEDVSGWARACTNIVYTNDVQTAPAEATNVA